MIEVRYPLQRVEIQPRPGVILQNSTVALQNSTMALENSAVAVRQIKHPRERCRQAARSDHWRETSRSNANLAGDRIARRVGRLVQLVSRFDASLEPTRAR